MVVDVMLYGLRCDALLFFIDTVCFLSSVSRNLSI